LTYDVMGSPYSYSAKEVEVLDEQNYQASEHDTETGGVWVVDDRKTHSSPSWTKTDTYTITGVHDSSYGKTSGSASGGWSVWTKQSADIGSQGTATSMSLSRTTYEASGTQYDEVSDLTVIPWASETGASESHHLEFHSKNVQFVQHVVTGSGSADPNATDATETTTHDTATTWSQVTSDSYPAPLGTASSKAGSQTLDHEVTVSRGQGKATPVLQSVTGSGLYAYSGSGRATHPDGWWQTDDMTNTSSWGYRLANGQASLDPAASKSSGSGTTVTHYPGLDDQTTTYDPNAPMPPLPPQDWFAQAANFGAGMGDAVSGGLTKKIRQGLGYDDVVNYQSGAYSVGEVAGQGVNVGLMFANPCAMTGVFANGVRLINGLNGVSAAIDAGQAFGSGGHAAAVAGGRVEAGGGVSARRRDPESERA
jgi:hypothetical protein